MMKIFGWEKEFSTGVKELDDQNKILLALLNKLLKMYYDGGLDPEYHKIYTTFMVYARNYFDKEEAVMHSRRYPQLLLHKNQHSEFLNRIELFNNEYLNGTNILFEFQRSILKWLEGHIKASDKKIALLYTPE